MSRFVVPLLAAVVLIQLASIQPMVVAEDPKAGKEDAKAKPAEPFVGRLGETKTRLLKEGGGNAASEKAVAAGLAWLAKQQMADGGWDFGKAQSQERAAATGMALMSFLGAGVTHKDFAKIKDFKGYEMVVKKGLDYLMKLMPKDGATAGRMSANMYAQGIATIALCEAYGMTKDKGLLPSTQAAINYIQKAQGPNGSWGYSAGVNGDTSISGWQIQALKAAKASDDIVVDDRVIKKAVKFLDIAGAGKLKSMYGYADNAGAAPGTSLTASGLLSRYYIDAWSQVHPGMIDGVGGLLKNPPVDKGAIKSLYFHYYATQVVHNFGGDDWKTWNEGEKQADGTRKGGLRDWLVYTQNKKEGVHHGSWDPEAGFFGHQTGQLGTTCLCLLSLEVYYRYPILFKRGDGKAINIID